MGANACKDDAKDTAAPADSGPSPADKEKADKEAKAKADKEKAEAEAKAKAEKEKADQVPAATLQALAVGDPPDDAIVIPDPPADQVEVVPAAPSPHHTWFPGYWHYDFPSRVYLWQEGIWIDRTDFPTVAPDPEPFEAIGRMPGTGFFYAPGFWLWDGVDYMWSPGHWARHREGFFFVHPYYEAIGGHWESRGWGFERHDADWDHRHEGWDHHGDLWVRPGYFKEREGYCRDHAAEVHARLEEAHRRPAEPEHLPEKHDPHKANPPKHDHPQPPHKGKK